MNVIVIVYCPCICTLIALPFSSSGWSPPVRAVEAPCLHHPLGGTRVQADLEATQQRHVGSGAQLAAVQASLASLQQQHTALQADAASTRADVEASAAAASRLHKELADLQEVSWGAGCLTRCSSWRRATW